MIFNDEYGIQNKSAFNAIKAILHPGLIGKLKKGISEKAAQRANILSLRDVGNNIEDLDFLEFFPELSTFFISSQKLSNVNGLRYLTKATCIELSSDWSGVVDISALSNCKELTELSIDRNLFGAGEKPNMTRNTNINIGGWSVIKELSKIEFLSIHDMGLTDISFLKHMVLLEDVDLGKNPISDLAPLFGHPVLKELDLTNCGIENISILSSIPTLESVWLDGNRIKDFSPLKEMKNLNNVSATANGLSDREIEKWKNELRHIEDLDFEPL